MLRQITKKRRIGLTSKKVSKQLHLYHFPVVKGLEDVSSKLNVHPAENIFGALLHGFFLSPILDQQSALEAERVLEYLNRAFEEDIPQEVEDYQYLLLMLLKEYDEKYDQRTAKEMHPHEFLKALLIEDRLSQKSLVPDCFQTESQVSEFLHQKKGRDKLSYYQAVALGKKFKVDPLNFL